MYKLNTLRCSLSLLNSRTKFTLDPSDIEVSNVLGSGPGGTRVATTKNCAVATHIPTNIIVKCHQTRSLEQNRRIAIKKLTEKVESHLYGAESSVAIKEEERRLKNIQRRQESKEQMEKRMEANKLKRELAEAAMREKIESAMKVGLPYLRNQVLEECDELEPVDEDPESSEQSCEEHGSVPRTIFKDDSNSQSRNSLKSMFGTAEKKK